MAAKRFFGGDEDQPNQKRMKTRPSFASVIREVVMVNFFENFCSSLEPMLRRVVSEEVENGLRRRRLSSISLGSYPSFKLIEQPSDHHQSTTNLQLKFIKNLSLPIFTGTKIADADGNPLQIVLEGGNDGCEVLPTSIKVEIVVLDGDFPEKDAWTSAEFAKNIVRERSGKRPLLLNNCVIGMRDGVCVVGSEIEFTDNSSWIRSRRFRLGARAVLAKGRHGGVVIREAITESFVVKDHRGELYKKHHPPALDDEVWRLEKIGKGGAFHQKLSSEGIKTVQDFMKLFIVDSSKLRKILGVGMSEKMWESTLKHAKTCVMGPKLYRAHGDNYSITLNPICQLVKAEINGHVFYERDLKRIQPQAYIESFIRDAYAKWNSLEEVDSLDLETPLLTQGEVVAQYPNEQQLVARSYISDSSCSIIQNNDVVEAAGNHYCSDDQWAAGFYLTSTINNTNCEARSGFRFFSESSTSEGDHIP